MAKAAKSKGGNSNSAPDLLKMFAACVLFRVVNAVCVRTFFSADEYWQSLEVAHKLVFGYGHLTWEWTHALRGYLHPLIFAVPYKIAQLVGLDSTLVMVWSPRLVQAVIAAAGDVHVYKLAHRWFAGAKKKAKDEKSEGAPEPDAAARWALFCSLACWFNFFCAVRTFSNCTEAALTVAALAYWPWTGAASENDDAKNVNRPLALALAAVSCAIRPAAALYWLPIFIEEAVKSRSRVSFIAKEAVPIGAVVLALSACVDRVFYGRWELVPWNFFKFNALEGGGALYGSHPWHWNLTQGYPAIATVFIPLAVMSCVGKKRWAPLTVIGWTVLGYSVPSHKEFRFLLPALAPALAAAGAQLASFSKHKRIAAVALIVLTQVPLALYLSIRHQSGVVSVWSELAKAVDRGETHSAGILSLTPCHQHPWTTHVHRPNVDMRFLKCDPPGFGTPKGELDEADKFLSDGGAFLRFNFGAGWAKPDGSLADAAAWREVLGVDQVGWDRGIPNVGDIEPGLHRKDAIKARSAALKAPSHVVMFDGAYALDGVAEWLKGWGFKKTADLHHADVPVDREIQSRVWVFSRPDTAPDHFEIAAVAEETGMTWEQAEKATMRLRDATKRRDAEETMTHEERIALHEKMNRERKEREERRAAELKRKSEEAAAAAAKAADPDAIIEARRKAEEEERLRKEEHERRKLTGEDDRPDEELTPGERMDRMIRKAAANIERAEAAAAKEADEAAAKEADEGAKDEADEAAAKKADEGEKDEL